MDFASEHREHVINGGALLDNRLDNRIEEIERRVGDVEKDLTMLRTSLLWAASSGSARNDKGGAGMPEDLLRSDPGIGDAKTGLPVDARLVGGNCETRYWDRCTPADARGETPGVVHNRLGEPYSIKLVYPGFYRTLDVGIPYCTVGFPNNKAKLAKGIKQDNLFFVYITSPVRRVIGLAQAMGAAEYRGDVDPERPWVATLEWLVGPKADGVSFADVGLEIRARTGDSVYAIPADIAAEFVDRLNTLCDLDQAGVFALRERFGR